MKGGSLRLSAEMTETTCVTPFWRNAAQSLSRACQPPTHSLGMTSWRMSSFFANAVCSTGWSANASGAIPAAVAAAVTAARAASISSLLLAFVAVCRNTVKEACKALRAAFGSRRLACSCNLKTNCRTHRSTPPSALRPLRRMFRAAARSLATSAAVLRHGLVRMLEGLDEATVMSNSRTPNFEAFGLAIATRTRQNLFSSHCLSMVA
mmetsp:Transcript_23270/g.64994  ORF Transcript_23270/g.64994 Transcript_23270/m.64994 type:complete len:208 (+) Transcript_23270:428-1051(+)